MSQVIDYISGVGASITNAIGIWARRTNNGDVQGILVVDTDGGDNVTYSPLAKDATLTSGSAKVNQRNLTAATDVVTVVGQVNNPVPVQSTTMDGSGLGVPSFASQGGGWKVTLCDRFGNTEYGAFSAITLGTVATPSSINSNFTSSTLNAGGFSDLAFDLTIYTLGTLTSIQAIVERQGNDNQWYTLTTDTLNSATSLSRSIGRGLATNLSLGLNVRLRLVVAGTLTTPATISVGFVLKATV